MSTHPDEIMPAPALTLAPTPATGALERMPKWAICIPLVLQWLWLSVRFGGATVPCAANPGITAGGMVGEGKLEYFENMGELGRAATAQWSSLYNTGSVGDTELQAALQAGRLDFPLIAKPDLGLCGYGVRKIDTIAGLREYVAGFPVGETIVLQRYLADLNEAGIFYARDPASGKGRIIGLALRYFPQVTGDGRRTVGELMANDARCRRLLRGSAHRVDVDTAHLPAAGEMVRLSTIGSTRVGGLYRDGSELATPALVAAIDAIARDMGEFHFGRFDVRFGSAAQLRQGRGFAIMEVNGAGSEAIEAWDPATSLLQGLRTVFAKQRLLFEIGAANRRRGAPTVSLLELARLNRRQNRLLDAYPSSN
jgi:hypothetical protein